MTHEDPDMFLRCLVESYGNDEMAQPAEAHLTAAKHALVRSLSLGPERPAPWEAKLCSLLPERVMHVRKT